MSTFDAELDMMLAEAGGSVTVKLGADSVSGILDSFDEVAGEGRAPGVIGNQLQVQLRTGALPALAVNSEVLITGTVNAVAVVDAPYRVRHRVKLDDGALTAIRLEKV